MEVLGKPGHAICTSVVTFLPVVAPSDNRTMKTAGIDVFQVKLPYAGGSMRGGGRIETFLADANSGLMPDHVLCMKALLPSGP